MHYIKLQNIQKVLSSFQMSSTSPVPQSTPILTEGRVQRIAETATKLINSFPSLKTMARQPKNTKNRKVRKEIEVIN